MDTFEIMKDENRHQFVCGFPYELSIEEGLLDPETVADDMSESDFSEIKWSMEMDALWYGSEDGAFFDFPTISKNRTIKYPMLPDEIASKLNNSQSIRIQEKNNGEIRVLSADIALMSSRKNNNDATAIFINQMKPSRAGRYSSNIVYADACEGMRTDEQALYIRKLYEDYKCDYIVLDTNGLGLGVYDALARDMVNPDTGELYPALSCCNNAEMASRCTVIGAKKVIWSIKASAQFNSDCAFMLREASNLAKYANIMANVGNTDVDTATTGITSIIKGYEMDASDAEHVSDVLVKVGQEYAISAEELMAAFQRGGAALHASGTDFEKSAALFAATNASLQNAETTGTMWKTVSARIRGATTELEEMGEETDGLAQGLSKYREEIMALSGVDIMKDENTYKDMYDIFVQLAEVWDNMEDVSQSRVAEILGGTRNTSGIMSTITNIKDAIGAYASAMDSAGTATEANNIYMDTTKAKVGELKAAFQELSSDVFDSDFTKGAVDALRGIVEAIDKVISTFGSLKTILVGLGIAKIIKNVA